MLIKYKTIFCIAGIFKKMALNVKTPEVYFIGVEKKMIDRRIESDVS
jgi:hypothetical protein